MSTTWLSSVYNFLLRTSQNEDLVAFPNLPLTGSLASIILLNVAYMSFVFKIGPWFMRNREPFNLQKVMMAYNAFQVIVCCSLLIPAFYYLFIADYYDLGCVLKLPPNHPMKRTEVMMCYCAYLTKYLDYCDTIFFVLRKSYRQVTFLHVYHHFVMTFSIYCYIRDYGFCGHAFSTGIVNCFVHIVMYSYYFLSAYRPEMKKSIWWKRHLTELQLVQFAIGLVHQMWPLVVRRDCTFPKFWLFMTNSQLIVFIVLFGTFYKKTYLTKKSKEIEATSNGLKKKEL